MYALNYRSTPAEEAEESRQVTASGRERRAIDRKSRNRRRIWTEAADDADAAAAAADSDDHRSSVNIFFFGRAQGAFLGLSTLCLHHIVHLEIVRKLQQRMGNPEILLDCSPYLTRYSDSPPSRSSLRS